MNNYLNNPAAEGASAARQDNMVSCYTNDQLQKIKDAAYKVAEAQTAFEEIAAEMAQAKTWHGQADIAHAASDLNELTSEGSINWMLRNL